MNVDSQDQEKTSNNFLYIILGAVLGAVTGAGAGYLLSKRIEEGEEIQLTAGDGIKLGGSIITFLRQISNLGS
jgi:membrane protein DedA with SNARE-associated domain